MYQCVSDSQLILSSAGVSPPYLGHQMVKELNFSALVSPIL